VRKVQGQIIECGDVFAAERLRQTAVVGVDFKISACIFLLKLVQQFVHLIVF